MQFRGLPETMLPGDPHCAPAHVVMAESLAGVLRSLHRNDSWNGTVNAAMLSRLALVRRLVDQMSLEAGKQTKEDDHEEHEEEEEEEEDMKEGDEENARTNAEEKKDSPGTANHTFGRHTQLTNYCSQIDASN